MQARQVPTEELGLVRGNYWQLLDDAGVLVRDRVGLPAAVTTAAAALPLLVAIDSDIRNDVPNPAVVAGQQRQDAFRADAGRGDLLTRLLTATPAQIDTYVDNNVTTIAQARTLFKAILKLIALDARS
jgi:hypothetical protein